MRESTQELIDLLNAKTECIWINSYEEVEVIKELKNIALKRPGTKLQSWSFTSGLQRLTLSKHEKSYPANPKIRIENIFKEIEKAQNSSEIDESIWVLKDLHLYNDTHQVKRAIRDLKEVRSKNYNPIVVISPVVSIPIEHQKLFSVINFSLPNKEYIKKFIDKLCTQKIKKSIEQGKDMVLPTEEEKRALVNACSGLTEKEIQNSLLKSISKYKRLDPKIIIEEKTQLIKKSGVLDYVLPKIKFEDIGGNHVFKEWFEETEPLFSEDAKEFGCEKPKGYLSLGIPGTAKSAFAEAIASKMDLPLIKFNMSKIMSRFVGESEQRIAQAFQIVETCAPCILFIDEVEKALAGNFLPS